MSTAIFSLDLIVLKAMLISVQVDSGKWWSQKSDQSWIRNEQGESKWKQTVELFPRSFKILPTKGTNKWWLEENIFFKGDIVLRWEGLDPFKS